MDTDIDIDTYTFERHLSTYLKKEIPSITEEQIQNIKDNIDLEDYYEFDGSYYNREIERLTEKIEELEIKSIYRNNILHGIEILPIIETIENMSISEINKLNQFLKTL